jgi:hypothetical protein
MTALLRWMLRITAVIGLILLAGALWLWLSPEPESSELPNIASGVIAVFLAVSLTWTLVPALGLIALWKQWRVPARLFLVLASIVPVASLLITMTDVREEASASELNWLVLSIPAWWWVICLLASTTPVLRAMGLVPRLWERAIPGVTLAAAGAVVAVVAWCNIGCTSPAEEALASLRPGMDWTEVIQTSAKLCPVSRSEVYAGVMWLRCQPTAPSTCAGAPTLAPAIELKFQNGKLLWWRERLQLVGFAPRQRDGSPQETSQGLGSR